MAGMRRMTRQPQGLFTIDKSHPLARGLIGFWIATAGGIISAVPGMPDAFLNQFAALQNGPKGVRYAGNAAWTGVAVIPAARLRPTNGITVLLEGKMPATGYTVGCEPPAANAGWGIWSQTYQPYLRINGAWVGVNLGLSGGVEAQVGFAYDGAGFKGVVNGRSSGYVAASGPITNSSMDIALNAQRPDGTNGGDGKFYYFAVWERGLTEAETAAFYENPWQVLVPEQRSLFTLRSAVAAPSGAQLSGGATAIASAFGGLSTAISLAGAAVGRASAAGALATSVRLTGAAAAQASGAAALSTGIRLVGAAAVQSSASGQLQGSASALSGGAYVQTSAAGSLATLISLAGAAAARSSGTGTLSFVQISHPSVDISKISPARIVVFEGSGSRVTPFDSGGSRVTSFDSSGSRVTPFEGSGSKTVRFE